MGYQFTEDEVNELLGEDLSLAASLAKLINEKGDIRAFLIKKLVQRLDEANKFHLSIEPQCMDGDEFRRSMGIGKW